MKENNPQTIYEQFERANSFKTQLNLIKDINRTVLFENGKQWNMDEDIAEFPKITLNIIKQIGKTRKSNIMQNEYGYLVTSTGFKDIRKIQDFLKHLAAKVNMKAMDLKALNDDYVKGTAIGYFYWDAEKHDFMSGSGGSMRYEVVDIRHFAVADPYIQTIQDQEWVIFVTREKVGALKAKYGADKEVVPDGNLYTTGTEKEPIADDDDDELVNVYTKFYRNNEGEVFFVVTTQNVMLKKPTAINPYYRGSAEERPNTTSLNDEKTKDTAGDERGEYKWTHYPFCRLCLNERDNSFYGLPIALEYIETQKSINNHYSVYDKALQDNVLGGFVFRKGVLDENEVTTENGQMLALDTLPNERVTDVFGRIPIANVPADSKVYSAMLIQTQREVAGTPNVQVGISDFSGQSGKQTEMLLQRAKENATDTAMMFNEFKREQAYIMFLFAKFFYDNEEFVVIEHGNDTDRVRDYLGENKFDGRKYLNDRVIIDIKVGAAPAFSEYTNIEMLGLMVQSGQAPFEAYINMLPEGFISNKQELINIAKNNSLKKIQSLEQQIQQQDLVMKQMSDAYKSMKKDLDNVDTVIKENERLKSMLAELSAKSAKTVGDATTDKIKMMEDVRNILNIAKKST
jgi:hypothetical protein